MQVALCSHSARIFGDVPESTWVRGYESCIQFGAPGWNPAGGPAVRRVADVGRLQQRELQVKLHFDSVLTADMLTYYIIRMRLLFSCLNEQRYALSAGVHTKAHLFGANPRDRKHTKLPESVYTTLVSVASEPRRASN